MNGQAIREAVLAIPVPPQLEAEVLAACRRAIDEAPQRPAVRVLPAVATVAACAAVLGVTLLSAGERPGQLPTQPTLFGTGTSGTSATTAENTVPSDAQTTTGKGGCTTELPHTTTRLPVSTTAPANPPTDLPPSSVPKLYDLGMFGRFEGMSEAQLAAYFGHRMLPSRLPEGLERRNMDNATLGIYCRDDEKIARNKQQWEYMLAYGAVRDAAVVSDLNSFYWVDWMDGRRELSVSVSTAPYPRYRLGDLTRFDETRQVAGVTVRLAHYDDAPYTQQWCYSALATVGKVEYYVTAWNISETEFLDTLASLLEDA